MLSGGTVTNLLTTEMDALKPNQRVYSNALHSLFDGKGNPYERGDCELKVQFTKPDVVGTVDSDMRGITPKYLD